MHESMDKQARWSSPEREKMPESVEHVFKTMDALAKKFPEASARHPGARKGSIAIGFQQGIAAMHAAAEHKKGPEVVKLFAQLAERLSYRLNPHAIESMTRGPDGKEVHTSRESGFQCLSQLNDDGTTAPGTTQEHAQQIIAEVGLLQELQSELQDGNSALITLQSSPEWKETQRTLPPHLVEAIYGLQSALYRLSMRARIDPQKIKANA